MFLQCICLFSELDNTKECPQIVCNKELRVCINCLSDNSRGTLDINLMCGLVLFSMDHLDQMLTYGLACRGFVFTNLTFLFIVFSVHRSHQTELLRLITGHCPLLTSQVACNWFRQLLESPLDLEPGKDLIPFTY